MDQTDGKGNMADQKKLDGDTTENEAQSRPLFVPGGRPGPGRRKGSRNRLGEAFVADLLADWQEFGPAAITAVRRNRPADYLKVIASILPKDLHIKTGVYDDLTDADLVARIRQLDAQVRPMLELQPAQPIPGETDAD
jgi:hypothetical protein